MAERIRLDKWLWQARFFKSRSLSAAFIEAGHLRLNGTHVAKPAQMIGPGDVLTFALSGRIRVVHVLRWNDFLRSFAAANSGLSVGVRLE